MAEKFKAETEFTTLSKKTQQRKADGAGADGGYSSLMDKQLSGAMTVLEESDRSKGLEAQKKGASKVLDEREEKVNLVIVDVHCVEHEGQGVICQCSLCVSICGRQDLLLHERALLG